jgi:hypothetical protein
MNKADFFKAVRELKPSQYPQYIKLNEGEYNAELRVYSPGSITEWDYMQMNRYHVPYRIELDENGEPYYKQIKWDGDKKWISTYYGIRSQVWNYSSTPDELAEKLVDTVDVDMAKLPEYLRDKQEQRERDERIKWESYFDVVKFLLAAVIGVGLLGALFN